MKLILSKGTMNTTQQEIHDIIKKAVLSQGNRATPL